MRFHKHEDFALLLMGELSMQPTHRVTLSHIAHSHGVSLSYLKKIVRNLRHAGLVQSKEGASGGYILAKKPGDISVWDVLESADSRRSDTPDEIKQRHVCPIHEDCLPQTIRRRVRGALEAELRALSLYDLVRS